MKKITALILFLLVLCSCGEQSAVINNTSSYTPPDVEYYDVCEAERLGKELFPKTAEGYYIKSGTYTLSKETFERVVGMPFTGEGAIKYEDWRRGNYTEGDTHIFDGVLPISKMNDPLYVVMCCPNEKENYRSAVVGEKNGDTLVPPQKKHANITPIGAVYLNEDCTLPDETELTLCFGEMKMALKYKGEDWFLAKEQDRPDDLDRLFPLPWQLEYDQNPIKTKKIDKSKIKKVDGHWEVKLTVGDFRRQNGDDQRLLGRVLHFWGGKYWFGLFKNGEDVEGLASSYQIWIKEKQYENVLCADVGVDLRNLKGNVDQAFATKSFAITSEMRSIYGHNVCPTCYDSVMDSQKVQQLLGIE